MIGGLQGDFGDLDNKYLKQNISKCQSHISGSFRRTSRHCAKRYKRIRICVTGEVETLSSPIRRQNSGCEHPGGKCAAAGCKWQHPGCKLAAAGWNSYPDMSPGCPLMVYPDNLSGYTPCMDSKELSSILDSFGDKKAIKTPKLNTI